MWRWQMCECELLTIIPWWKRLIKFPFCFRSVTCKFEVSEFQFELRNDSEEQKNDEDDSFSLKKTTVTPYKQPLSCMTQQTREKGKKQAIWTGIV